MKGRFSDIRGKQTNVVSRFAQTNKTSPRPPPPRPLRTVFVALALVLYCTLSQTASRPKRESTFGISCKDLLKLVKMADSIDANMSGF